MRFETESVDNILIVSPPQGDLDASNSDEFKRDIAAVVDGYKKVILNIEPVPFMDSAGMGALLSVYKKVMADGGQFRIYGLSKEVKTLFDLVRMQRLFEIHQEKESAVQSLK